MAKALSTLRFLRSATRSRGVSCKPKGIHLSFFEPVKQRGVVARLVHGSFDAAARLVCERIEIGPFGAHYPKQWRSGIVSVESPQWPPNLIHLDGLSGHRSVDRSVQPVRIGQVARTGPAARIEVEPGQVRHASSKRAMGS